MADAPAFLDEAWDEVVEAALWHEDRVVGLGDRVYDETEVALQRIATAPLAGTPWTHTRVPREVRRMPLKSFPYSLFYVVEPGIVVVAFAHLKRRPGYWAGRLDRT